MKPSISTPCSSILPAFLGCLALTLGAPLPIAAVPLSKAAAKPAETDYTPMLPKTGVTEKVIVVDVYKDKMVGTDAYNSYYHFSESHDAIFTISALQGLINRDSSTKIYLTNVPGQIAWYPEVLLFDAEDDPSSTALEDGLIPFPIEYAELDSSKRFPALSWLLDNYGHLVKGKALCASTIGFEHDVTATSGTRAAALNACTFENYLPVTPPINKYLMEEGYRYEVAYDLRDMGNVEAMRWSMDKYLDHPKRERRLLSAWSEVGTHPSTMADYFVATYTFNYFYNRRHQFNELFGSKLDDEAGDPLLRELLGGGNFQMGAPHFGAVEMSHLIKVIQEYGFTCVCGHFPNGSVTSSIPTDPGTFTPSAEPRVLPVDPNGIYLAWNGPDGDNINFAFTFNYPALRNDPMTGDVPMGWRINPYIIDLFPTLYAWYTEQGPSTIDLVSSPNDGGDPQGEEGRAYWKKTYLNYVENSNNSIRVVNFMGGFPNDHFHEIMGDDGDFQMVINGYQGMNDYDTQFLIRENTAETVYVNQIGYRGPKPSMIGQPLVENTYGHLLGVIDKELREGEPYFIMARLPSECGINGFTIAQYLTDRLQRSINRPIYLVRPSDFAMTYRHWVQAQPLAALADQSSQQLETALRAEAGETRAHAAWEWVRRGVSSESIETLHTLLEDSNRSVREAAVSGLARLFEAGESQAVVQALLRALETDSDPIVQGMAARALAAGKVAAAKPALLEQLGSESGEYAAHALAQYGPDVIPDLAQKLSEARSDEVRRDVAIALRHFGPRAAPITDSLVEALQAADERLALLALLDTLDRIGPTAEDGLPVYIRLSARESDQVAPAAIRLIGKWGAGSDAAVQALIEALDRKRTYSAADLHDEFGRVPAMQALAKIGPGAEAALPRLRELSRHRRPQIHNNAEKAIQSITAERP